MVQRRAIEASEGQPGSGLHPRARLVYALRDGSIEYPLTKQRLVLGRGTDVDVLLAGPLVSRRHAELRETEHGFVLSDLGSRNGVFVNDLPIGEPTLLAIGDTVTIGETHFELVEVEPPTTRPVTLMDMQAAPDTSRAPASSNYRADPTSATRRAEALQLLGGVVDKALALGRGQEAEHVIGTHLVAVLSDASAGRGVSPEVARSSAQYAVKLASATGKAAWLDFAFRLYNALGEIIPLPIVDEMYTVLRRVRGVDRELLRSYSEFLRANSERLSPPQRFVLQRLEGLERLASWQPID